MKKQISHLVRLLNNAYRNNHFFTINRLKKHLGKGMKNNR